MPSSRASVSALLFLLLLITMISFWSWCALLLTLALTLTLRLLWALLTTQDALQCWSNETHQTTAHTAHILSVRSTESDIPSDRARDSTTWKLTRTIVVPMEVAYVSLIRIWCVPLVIAAWVLRVGWDMSVVVPRVLVLLDDFGEVGLAFGANDAVLIPVPLVLALVTEDQLALLGRLIPVHADEVE